MKPSFIAFVLVGVVLAVAVVFLTFQQQGEKVEIRDDAPWFFPTVLEIEPGATVTWLLKSPVVHPVMTVEGPEELHSGHFSREWSHKFTKPGVYVYICSVHPYMKGVIGVGRKIPKEKIPLWASWPPSQRDVPGGKPVVGGAGRLWVDAQFHRIEGKEKPGSIIVVNAETWEVEEVIDEAKLNNPHNLAVHAKLVLQTNWFDKYLSAFNKDSKKLEKNVLIGESPAHALARPQGDKVYVSVQGDDVLAVLDPDLNVLKRVRAPVGPHGFWMSDDGKRMALASTEAGNITAWDLEKDEKIFEAPLHEESEKMQDGHKLYSLPLMAGVTVDGRFAFAATSATGKFFVFDIEAAKLVKSFEIGPVPIQTVPSPDGKYVLVPLTGSSELAVVDASDWSLKKKIAGMGLGAHGVAYGRKNTGGYYAYVSSKFAPWVTVVDLDSLEVAGYVQLPKEALGGQGIAVVD